MIRLHKFYSLIDRNALVTLTNEAKDCSYFEGSVKDIPDGYDDWEVIDFCVSDNGDFLFKVRKPKENA